MHGGHGGLQHRAAAGVALHAARGAGRGVHCTPQPARTQPSRNGQRPSDAHHTAFSVHLPGLGCTTTAAGGVQQPASTHAHSHLRIRFHLADTNCPRCCQTLSWTRLVKGCTASRPSPTCPLPPTAPPSPSSQRSPPSTFPCHPVTCAARHRGRACIVGRGGRAPRRRAAPPPRPRHPPPPGMPQPSRPPQHHELPPPTSGRRMVMVRNEGVGRVAWGRGHAHTPHHTTASWGEVVRIISAAEPALSQTACSVHRVRGRAGRQGCRQGEWVVACAVAGLPVPAYITSSPNTRRTSTPCARALSMYCATRAASACSSPASSTSASAHSTPNHSGPAPTHQNQPQPQPQHQRAYITFMPAVCPALT